MLTWAGNPKLNWCATDLTQVAARVVVLVALVEVEVAVAAPRL